MILDNCPPDLHRKLQKGLASSDNKIHLLTVEYDVADDTPEETQVVKLEPAGEKAIAELVKRRFPALGPINAKVIAEFSGGNARLALALAGCVELGESLTKFSDEDLFKRLFFQRRGKDNELLDSAELLSLVYSFNSSDKWDRSSFPHYANPDELRVLGDIADIGRKALFRDQAELLRRQLAQKRGDWRAVLPHALANRLARYALQNISHGDINKELFKPGNIRLLKSCAHRLGFLHDCDEVRDLAESWFAEGAPLHDLASYNDDKFACLSYLAPLLPERILTILERMIAEPDSKFMLVNFDKITSLLRHIAYEERYFDRAANALLKLGIYGEAHLAGRKRGYEALSSLFALQLSGTQASPQCRQDFVRRLLAAGRASDREIARGLLEVAFSVGGRVVADDFSFGARARNTGWRPKIWGDCYKWYLDFLHLLEPLLQSNDTEQREWAKSIIAAHFRGLSSLGGDCFDMLEKLVQQYGRNGAWPAMRVAIQDTIKFDGDKCRDEILQRLQALEVLTAPTDLHSQINVYAFTPIWQQMKAKSYDEGERKQAEERLISLGQEAASDTEYLRQLSGRFLDCRNDSQSLMCLGQGIARGSSDPMAVFSMFIEEVNKADGCANLAIIGGFLQEVHNMSPDLFRGMIDFSFDELKHKQSAVPLLCSAPLDDWAINKLIEWTQLKHFTAADFGTLHYGGRLNAVSNKQLEDFLNVLAEMPDSAPVILRILDDRCMVVKASNPLSIPLILIGRKAVRDSIEKSVETGENFDLNSLYWFKNYCFSASAGNAWIEEILKVMLGWIQSMYFMNPDWVPLFSELFSNFPDLCLNSVFTADDAERWRIDSLFKENSSSNLSLNMIPIAKLLDWAGEDQEKIQKLALGVGIYEVSADSQAVSHLVLSEHIKALLNVAEDKKRIIETIFERIHPSGWSNSLANILEARFQALKELLNYTSGDVQEFVKQKLSALSQQIEETRIGEDREFNRENQSFE